MPEYDVHSMAEMEKVDAIVVGAGPAGSSAAITMARAGLQVIVLERGEKPGAKNVMGGILYRHMLEEVVGDAWKEAPLERPIIEEQRWVMTKDAAIRALGYKDLRNREHPHSFSVLRARFDPWYAGKAEAAGAFVITDTVAEELIRQDGRVVGVRTGREGDLLADVVVVCEGIGLGTSLLEKAGLGIPTPRRGDGMGNLGRLYRDRLGRMEGVALAFKEIIQLDPQLIESRFNCEPGEGASVECYGEATMGMSGFMFIYTNRDTLSVGGGALLSDFVKTRRTPNEVQENFKRHPAIRPLLQGGETVEYLAHQIPEAGFRGVPKVFGDGYLVCGDAAGLSNPVHREGSNLAMTSGRLAGETVIRAKEVGDFSERLMREYRLKLNNSWIIPDMKKYDRAVPLLERNPQMLNRYPDLLDRALDEFFRVDGVSKWEKQRRIARMLRKEGGLRMAWDVLFKAPRTLGFMPPFPKQPPVPKQ
jgi:electron transfer flavoprotein-quinone oxidoreductase